MPYNKFRTNCL